MIACLNGKLIYKSPEYSIIDVSGVGYQVFTPYSTFFELPDVSATIMLNIYTHVREDILQLFGFLSVEEKDVFKLLLTVSGIGPKLAVNILSGISAEELLDAISSGNLVRLTAIPGIGKKTAERIVLELKDKALKISSESGESRKSRFRQEAAEYEEDAISALINLGYKRQQAEGALDKVKNDSPGTELEGMIKGALKILARQ